jgi:glucan biosynthesis protein C
MYNKVILLTNLIFILVLVCLYDVLAVIPEVVLDASDAINLTGGVEVIVDPSASIGKALKITNNPNNPGVANPTTYFEMVFLADAAKYYIWLRGKSDTDDKSDAVWMQFDDEIGTDKGLDRSPNMGLGNWRDLVGAVVYTWASNPVAPKSVESVTFTSSGRHKLRAQSRQVPHYIDQIWLSTTQGQWPETLFNDPLEKPVVKAVSSKGKLTATWSAIKARD